MKLTKEQAIIVSAYTGVTAMNFGFLHEAVENALYNRDIETAKKHLDNVTTNMFDY